MSKGLKELYDRLTSLANLAESLAFAIRANAERIIEKDTLYGEEGDLCGCGHLYCYHCEEDKVDGTVAGCQVQQCDCKKVWRGK